MTRLINRSAPKATIVPVLIYEDVAKAIDWLCTVFGFSERLRAGPGNRVLHAQLTFGDAAIMLGQKGAEFVPPRPPEVTQYVVVHLDDVDRHFERARELGATIVQPPVNQMFGERQYTALDLEGHRWTFSQSVADVAPEAWGARTN